MKIFQYEIFKKNLILLGILFLFIGCQAVDSNSSGWFWKHEPFHSIVESLGAFAAITLALLILLILKQKREISYHFWTSCALIGMGMLDGFHAGIQPGNSFVWLHSIATLVGGMLFALVWLPERFVALDRITIVPIIVAILSTLVGIFTLIVPDHIPVMLSQGNFTITANVINSLGGLFFIAAALRFYILFMTLRKVDEILFTFHCLLFGIAALLFDFSKLWDLPWWIWHMLRFSAYLIALSYFIILYNKNNMQLRVEIKERKQAEEALRYERNKVIGILNAIEDGVYIVNQQYDIEYINPILKKEFGSVEGRKCYQYFHDREEVCPWCKNPEVFVGKTVRWEWYSSKKQLTYDLIDTPLTNPDGSISKLEIFRDITERKKAEETLKKSQAQLSQAEKMIAVGTMVAGVAHELNNPMMAIVNFIEYCLKNTSPDDKRFPILQDAERETNRCIDIVNNLLTFSHKEKEGEGEFQKESCATILGQVLDLLSYRFESAKVIKHYAKGIPEITMKVNSIQQVFLNIITNALDALNESKRKEIYIDIKQDVEFVQVTIADSGHGIAPEILPRIFDPFFTTKPLGQGTGLGLSISQSIIETHEGSITCNSTPGQGAKFEILLPIKRKEVT